MPIRSHSPRRRTTPARARRLPHWATLLAVALLAACSGEAPLPGDPLRLLATSLPDAVRGEPYQQDLVPSGGLRPYTFTLEDGALPPGLALQGGTIIGTPTDTGRYEFTISLSDANLSTTYEDWVLTVRDLPVPTLELAVPATEVRGEVVLRARVRDARDLRALRLRIDWQDAGVAIAPATVRTSRNDLAIFVDERDDGVSIDLAVLGEPIDGEVELFELVLTPSEPVVLGAEVRSEFLYSGRHAYQEDRVGAPPAATGPAPGEEGVEDEAPTEEPPTEDGTPEDGEPASEGADGEATPGADENEAEDATPLEDEDPIDPAEETAGEDDTAPDAAPDEVAPEDDAPANDGDPPTNDADPPATEDPEEETP